MNKILIYAVAFFFSLSILFGYLSYSFYSDKASAQRTIEHLEKANEDLVVSFEAQAQACKIADEIASEFINEVLQLDQQKDDVISQIDKLPSRLAPIVIQNRPEESQRTSNDKNTVSLDEPLPSELVRMLTEVHNNVQRQGSHNAR